MRCLLRRRPVTRNEASLRRAAVTHLLPTRPRRLPAVLLLALAALGAPRAGAQLPGSGAVASLTATPADPAVRLAVGETMRFRAQLPEADLRWRWTLDGRDVGSGPQWTFVPAVEAVGEHRLEVTVASATTTARRTWTVRVEPPRPPRLLVATPETDVLTVAVDQDVVFRMQVEPAVPDEDVQIAWTADGAGVGAGETLRWRAARAGTVRVRALATGSHGAAVAREWRVVVSAPPETTTTTARPTTSTTTSPTTTRPPPTAAPTTTTAAPTSSTAVPAPTSSSTTSSTRAATTSTTTAPATTITSTTAEPTTTTRRSTTTTTATTARPTSSTWYVTTTTAERPTTTRMSTTTTTRGTTTTRVPPTTTTTAPPAAAAPSAGDALDAAGVRAFMTRWAAAWSRQDVAELRRLGQVTTDAQAEALQDYFDRTPDLTVGVEVLDVEVEGDRATVRFRRNDRFRDPTGQTVSQSATLEKTIVRGPGGLRLAPAR